MFYNKYSRIVLLLAFSICLFLLGTGLFYLNSRLKEIDSDYQPREQSPPFAKPRPNSGKPKTNNDEPSTLVKEIGNAKVKYYPNKASVISTTNYFYGYYDSVNRINMQAFFECFYREVYEPENIKLRFEYSVTEARYSDKLSFGIMLNDKTVFEKDMILDPTNEHYRYFATLILEIPYELFTKMAKEKNVKFLFGTTVIDLKGKHIEPFKDLIKTIGTNANAST